MPIRPDRRSHRIAVGTAEVEFLPELLRAPENLPRLRELLPKGRLRHPADGKLDSKENLPTVVAGVLK